MFVCRKCHEIDKVITKCDEDFDNHILGISGKCAICGKHTSQLKWCVAYTKHRSKGRFRDGTSRTR